MTKKYIGYIRVSNKEHDTSLPAQKEKLQNYAYEKGIDLVEIYTEEKSAFKANKRKQFDKMINHLKKDDISGVIFHKVDRSSRNMKDFSTLESFFDSKDILVIEGEFDTSRAQGRFMFRMFCNMAIWYSENLSEEVRLKMKERLKAGYYPRMQPFGYRVGKKSDPDQKRKYPDENARYVKEMFRLYDGGGYSYRSLAKHFREKGIPMKKGQVELILSNPFYYGLIQWKHRKENEVCYYQGNHEPIISKELYAKVERRRLGRTTNKGVKTHSNPYTQKVICECGKFLYFESSWNGKSEKRYSYLRCHNKDCSFTAIKVSDLESQMLAEMSSYIGRLKWLDEYNEQFKKQITSKEDLEQEQKSLRLKKGQIKSQIENIGTGFVEGFFTKKEATRRKEELLLKEANIIERLKEIDRRRNCKKTITPRIVLELFKNLATAYSTANLKDKIRIFNYSYLNLEIKDKKPVFKRTPELSALVSLPKTHSGRLEQTITESYLRRIVECYKRL